MRQRQPQRGRALMKTNEEIVATGFTFPEGPCINRAGVLHLVELRNRYVSRVVDGRRIVFAELGWSPNGAAFGPDGGLYTCNSGGNWPPTPSTNGVAGFGGETPSIQVVQPDGARRSILTQIEGRRLNAPNDICFDAKGGFYFSDPAWAARTPEGVARAEHSPPGDISYVAPDGRASRVAGDLLFPNGLCVSPDGQSLIVAETGTGRVLSYAIGRNGALYSPNTLIELGLESGLDGMAFDADGRLLIAGCGSGTIYVLAPDLTGVQRTLVCADPALTNLCFGGQDFKTLFVTQGASGSVAAIRWPVPGMVTF
jgi:gluconolactonase